MILHEVSACRDKMWDWDCTV